MRKKGCLSVVLWTGNGMFSKICGFTILLRLPSGRGSIFACRPAGIRKGDESDMNILPGQARYLRENYTDN